MTALLVLGGFVLLLLLTLTGLVGTGLRIVRQRDLVERTRHQVTTELGHRHDLVLALVATATTHAGHERAALSHLVAARDQAVRAGGAGGSVAGQASAETVLAGAIRGLLAVAQAYPGLLAAEPYEQLQSRIAATEDRIATARHLYNQTVRVLNAQVRRFPSSLAAWLLSVAVAEAFETNEPLLRAPVSVSFQVPPTC